MHAFMIQPQQIEHHRGTYTFPAASNSLARSCSLVLKDKFPTNTLVLTMVYVDEGLRDKGHTQRDGDQAQRRCL